MNVFSSPWGSLRLERHPYPSTPNLQAWNAADEILLRHCFLNFHPGARLLVLGDTFGALTLSLLSGGFTVVSSGDSALSQRALLLNLEANGLKEDRLEIIDSLTIPKGPFEGIVARIPRTLAFWEWQLHMVERFDVPLVAGAMTKDIHTSTLEVTAQWRGPVTTTRAEKKARLILAPGPLPLVVPKAVYPKVWKLPSLDCTVTSHANVFSSQTLDGGTSLLLRNFPTGLHPQSVVDLGCGTGLIGLAAARAFPKAKVTCIDESFMAVWSALHTFQMNGYGTQGAFLTADGLEDFSPGEADLILCNPPFHFQHVQTQEVARRMFHQARRVLTSGGQFWVVANHHLGYHKELKDLFTEVKVAAQDEKFYVLRCLV